MPEEKYNEKHIEMVQKSYVPVPMCEEFKRMISGLDFAAGRDPKMLDHKLAVKKLLLEFNDPSIPEDETYKSLADRRNEVGRRLFGKVGRSTNVESGFFCTWGCNIFIGSKCYFNRNVSFFDSAPITLGNRVLIGPGVSIHTDCHETDAMERRRLHGFAKPVEIGNDVWICGAAQILPGAKIGDGCIIAAGAVVNGDVPADSLVAGVPAIIKRNLKTGETNGD